MAAKKEILQTETSLPQNRLLQVHLSWRSNTISITEPHEEILVYLVRSNPSTGNMVFKTGTAVVKALQSGSKIESIDLDAGNDVIGSTKFKFFSNSSDLYVRGRPITLSSVNKRVSVFQYASAAFAASPEEPVMLYWHLGESKLISFELHLRDGDDQMIAKLSTRDKKHGQTMSIELFGPRAWDSLAAEEVLVTGLTVFIALI